MPPPRAPASTVGPGARRRNPMSGDRIELLFLGTGTSAGVPMIGCHCEVCESKDPRDKRTRPSVMFQYGGVNVLVDTSPRSEEHTSELQSRGHLVCRLLLE